MNDLCIADTQIHQDAEGRYFLNDLHRAAVASGITKDIRPNEWLALDQTRELVKILITENPGSKPTRAQAGRYGGTYVAKELVYAYAMWISAAFHLKVIRAYDSMVTAEINRLNSLHYRAVRAELEYLEGVEHASRCGLGLSRWRNDKKDLKNRLEALKFEMQPLLPLFH